LEPIEKADHSLLCRSVVSDPRDKALYRATPTHDPIVITGIGMIASVGNDRESVWHAVRSGRSAARHLEGFPGIPDGMMLGALVDIEPEVPGQLKAITLCQRAAAEAIQDAHIDFRAVQRERFACAISGHMGDTRWTGGELTLSHLQTSVPWWEQWLPNTACSEVANRWGLYGPRMCHSTACASGLVDIISAVRALQDDQCDIALAGSAEAVHPLFAAGFHQMRVLAYHDDPARACRPFDETREGFIMGEGAAMFVLERLSRAQRRGARIYAEVLGSKTLADAHHLTGLDMHSDTLVRLISDTLRVSGLKPRQLEYINAHGTGTRQNDLAESRGIRRAMGKAADAVCISATKSILGHLVNAAGSVELAITTLAMRDGFLPPTLNLTRPDPQCNLDCIPLVGRNNQFEHAMKLSVAFGGHLAAIALRRWNDARTGFDYPSKLFAA
jgi:3-oxoacyl-(acyl-carrier-protein) synthase